MLQMLSYYIYPCTMIILQLHIYVPPGGLTISWLINQMPGCSTGLAINYSYRQMYGLSKANVQLGVLLS